MAKLKDHPSYILYAKGQVDEAGNSILQNGKVQRPEYLRPWKKNEDGTITIVLGEVFCRFSRDGQTITCDNKTAFSSESNMMHHARKHKERGGVLARIKDRKPGSAKVSEVEEAMDWYDDITKLREEGRVTPEIATPKKRKEPASPHLLQLPTQMRKGVRKVNVTQMLTMVGRPSKQTKANRCAGCVTVDNNKCPQRSVIDIATFGSDLQTILVLNVRRRLPSLMMRFKFRNGF